MRTVLLVAPTVDGTDVGEAWVGYQWAHHLSQRFEVTLLTYRKRDRPSAVPQLPAARVIEWTEPPLLGRAERLNSLLKPGYLPFEVRARRWIRDAIRRGEHFDVAHQAVPVAMRYPSPLTGMGIPWLLGPVGGSLDSPPGFAGEDTAPWYTRLRAIDGLRMRYDPVLRRTYQDATCVLGIAPYVRDALAGVGVRRLEYLAETALEALPARSSDSASRSHDGVVRLLFVGRLVRTKGARDAIAAMAHLRDLPVQLDVVGDGFDRAECERLVHEAGLTDRVHFSGAQPRDVVQQRYREAHVFVFPSYREPGGNVVFEAMGHGLPLIVCDRGGPGNVVTDDCGILVKAESPKQLAGDVADAIRRLVENPGQREQMGRASLERVREVGLWEAKIDQISHLYAEISESPRE